MFKNKTLSSIIKKEKKHKKQTTEILKGPDRLRATAQWGRTVWSQQLENVENPGAELQKGYMAPYQSGASVQQWANPVWVGPMGKPSMSGINGQTQYGWGQWVNPVMSGTNGRTQYGWDQWVNPVWEGLLNLRLPWWRLALLPTRPWDNGQKRNNTFYFFNKFLKITTLQDTPMVPQNAHNKQQITRFQCKKINDMILWILHSILFITSQEEIQHWNKHTKIFSEKRGLSY